MNTPFEATSMENKEKLTLAQKIARRKIKPANNFVWWLYGVLAHMPFFAPKYKPTYIVKDHPKDCPTGCFVIWNHLSRRDYLFLRVMLAPRKFSMVAGYTEFFRSHLALLFKLCHIVPKKPMYSNDIASISAMMKLIKQGEIVTFSPEGTSSIFGDNQPITPGTARFLKKVGVPVYFAEFRGHYLCSNKVDITDKPGPTEVILSKLFTPEDLKELTAEEIEVKINEKLKHDDFEWNKVKQYSYKGKGKMCERLEEMLYECPKCGKRFVTKGEKDTFKCTCCGNAILFRQDSVFMV